MSRSATAWRAPRALTPVHGTVKVPGSKSITNRALILGCLSGGPSEVHQPLLARDTTAMANGLTALGHEVLITDDVVRINPHGGADVGSVTVNCDQAGTVMRFLPALASLARGDVTFDADESARKRPMAPIIMALRALGAQMGVTTTLPFTIHGSGHLTGGHVTLDASASSQFVSALLLVAARTDNGVTITHHSPTGADVPSQPHIDMTINMLAAHGVAVREQHVSAGRQWSVSPTDVKPQSWHVEPDLSNALPFLVAAAVTGGEVRVPRLAASTLQPLAEVTNVLRAAGCVVSADETDLVVQGPQTLEGIDVDLSDIAETTVTFAAMCAHAQGTSTLRGIGHIRGHETDRVNAIIEVLTSAGCQAEYSDNALLISPAQLRPALLPAFADHRMATAGAILGLAVDDIYVDDISTTSKTMPNFPNMWAELIGRAAA